MPLLREKERQGLAEEGSLKMHSSERLCPTLALVK